MFINNTFGKTVDILHRAMSASVLRREVIANNLANVDTPNFKRSDVNFESQLKRALDSEKEVPGLQAKTTDTRHFSFYQPMDYKMVGPKRILDYLTNETNNGNNVDPEAELMAAQRNQMQYTLLAQAVNNEFNQVNLILRSGV